MHCEIIDCYFKHIFFFEVQLKKEKKNLKSVFWEPEIVFKLVYRSSKQAEYVTDKMKHPWKPESLRNSS